MRFNIIASKNYFLSKKIQVNLTSCYFSDKKFFDCVEQLSELYKRASPTSFQQARNIFLSPERQQLIFHVFQTRLLFTWVAFLKPHQTQNPSLGKDQVFAKDDWKEKKIKVENKIKQSTTTTKTLLFFYFSSTRCGFWLLQLSRGIVSELIVGNTGVGAVVEQKRV